MYEHVARKRVGSVVCHYSVQFSVDLWHMEFRRVGTSIHMHHQSHILWKCIWWQGQEGIVLHWSILNTPYCLQACLFHERCVLQYLVTINILYLLFMLLKLDLPIQFVFWCLPSILHKYCTVTSLCTKDIFFLFLLEVFIFYLFFDPHMV